MGKEKLFPSPPIGEEKVFPLPTLGSWAGACKLTDKRQINKRSKCLVTGAAHMQETLSDELLEGVVTTEGLYSIFTEER